MRLVCPCVLRHIRWSIVFGLSAALAFGASPKPSSPTEIYKVCKNNLRSKYWAQLTVDADLMRAELERLRLPLDGVKVAVVDSGFDLKHNASRMAAAHLAVKKGFPKAGEPEDDKDGHGTRVASLIGGTAPLGIAPGVTLTVYRATERWGGGSTSHDNLNASIRKACDEGNEVINVSWGSTYDEAGKERDEVKDKAFLDELAKKGCLVVKSAGNDAYRKAYSTNDLDDAYLRAAALTDTNTLAEFSSLGEVAAPGAFVFTLESQVDPLELEKQNDRKCESDTGSFVNGTSFSAPVTTALAANVIAVLKYTGKAKYLQMSPPDRIRLVNRILKASEFLGTVNGLRAVLIAERWAKQDGAPEAPQPEQLAALLSSEPPSFCHDAFPRWHKGLDQVKHAFELRRELAACPGVGDGSKKDDRDVATAFVFAFYNNARVLEQADRWVRALDEHFLGRFADFYRLHVDQLWASHIAKWKIRAGHDYSDQLLGEEWAFKRAMRTGGDFDELLTLLPTYVITRKDDSKLHDQVTQIIAVLLENYQGGNRMSRRSGRGSEEDFTRELEVLEVAAKKTSTRTVTRTIDTWIDSVIRHDAEHNVMDSRRVLYAFRLLDAIQKSEPLERAHRWAFDRELEIFEQINDSNRMTLAAVAEEKPSMAHLAVSGDLNEYEVGYLDSFFDRHRERILEVAAGDSGGALDPTRLNAFFVAYFLRGSHPGFDAEEKEAFYLATLDAIASGKGWNLLDASSWLYYVFVDHDLAYYAERGLTDLYRATKDESTKRRIRERYRAIYRRAVSLDFYRRQLPEARSYHTIASFTKAIADENPLLDLTLVEEAATRLIMALPKLSPEVKFRNMDTISKLLSAIVPDLRLTKEKIPSLEGPLYFVELPEKGMCRTRKCDPKVIELGSPRPVSELFDAFLVDWADFLKTNPANGRKPGYLEPSTIHSFAWQKGICEALPAKGQWREHLHKLHGALRASTMDVYGDYKYHLEGEIEHLFEACPAPKP